MVVRVSGKINENILVVVIVLRDSQYYRTHVHFEVYTTTFGQKSVGKKTWKLC
jgi:hypothetical protein